MTFPNAFAPPKHIRQVCFSIVKCVSDVTAVVVGGGLLQKIFGLNGVKSCIFRQNKHGNAPS